MFKKHLIFCLICFVFVTANAQYFSTKIEGHVYSKGGDVVAIHVSNISVQRATITNAKGFFTISAKLNDTLVFTAVQFKKKLIVVNNEILKNKILNVWLETVLTQLDEVVVRPYNLTGELDRDMKNLKIGPIVTASTLDLPNAQVKPPTQSQRKLYAARTWDAKLYGLAITAKLDPLFNYFSGRTKMLNERVAREAKYKKIKKIRKFFADSLYIKDLKIPQTRIIDFVYFCEVDSSFFKTVAIEDKLQLWQFMKKKSLIYRKNNSLD